jgi:type I restriction enzyme S subunit
MPSQNKHKFKETEIGMIPEDWAVEPIETCLEKIIDYRGKTPQKTSSGVPLVTAKIIKKGHIDLSNCEYIDEADYDNWMRRGLPKSGDVIFTTEGPLGEIAQIDNKKVALAQRILTLRGKKEYLNNTYLKYYLISPIGQHELHSRATGTTVQGIKQSEFRKIKVVLPNYEDQIGIAEILSSLDDKIKLNQQMNKTLEKIGQAIFKHWFIDFEFPDERGKPYKSSGGEMIDSELGEIPKAWTVGKLGDICVKITDGSHYSPKERDGHNCIATVKNMGVYDFDLDTCKKISKEDYKSLVDAGCKPEKGDILFSKDGTMGITHLCVGHQDIVLLSSIAILRPQNKSISNYLYAYLKNDQVQRMIFEGFVSGSALPRIVLKDIKKIPILIPPDEIIVRLNQVFDPNIAIIIHNEEEARMLAIIRDSLLPKLMSGGIRVPVGAE